MSFVKRLPKASASVSILWFFFPSTVLEVAVDAGVMIGAAGVWVNPEVGALHLGWVV